MARTPSNLPEIEAVITAVGQTLAFDRTASTGSLGSGALSAVTGAISERCKAEEAPGGAEWAKNKKWADRNPQKRGKPVGILTGEMLSAEQIAGTPTVDRDSASVEYGISDDAKQKAQWFTEGGSNQAPRPFFDLDDRTEAAVDAYLDGEIDRYLGSL